MDLILFAKLKRLERRVAALESGSGGGNTGGGGNSGGGAANQIIVEFERLGEYGSYSISEVEHFHVSDKVPTIQQLEQSEMRVIIGETEHRFHVADVHEYDGWAEVWYDYEYGEGSNHMVTIVYDCNNVDGVYGNGVFVIFDNIRYQLNEDFDSGWITFPEVSA